MQRTKREDDLVAARVSCAPLDGNLPPRVLALVVEWASLHQGALIDNWRRLQADEAPRRIPPLE